jgi:hypothetical protein
MANPTKADIQNELLDVKAQLDAKDQELLALKDQMAAEQSAAEQPVELSKIEKRKQRSDNTTVVLVRRCFPVTTREGQAVEGGFKLPAVQSMDVNYGTKEKPDYKKHQVQETWFEVWNNGTPEEPNPVADQLNTLIQSTEYAILRLYWEFNCPSTNVYTTDETNDKGVKYKKTNFRYAPKKRIFAFDTLSQKDLEAETQEEIKF